MSRLLSPVLLLAACGVEPAALPGAALPTPVVFDLEVSALEAAAPLSLAASGLSAPGRRVTFLVSVVDGPGRCAPDGSACLDIGAPARVLGSALTDGDGVARLDVVAPGTLLEGRPVHFQAVAVEAGAWVTSDVETREVGDPGVCADAWESPHDPALPEWTYHGVDDGVDDWGDLAGYGLCGTGTEQTPIALETSAAGAGTAALEFHDYATDVPLALVNSGHTLQVDYASQEGPTDPRITFDGRTWYLRQFHVHSTSEHTLDGESFAFEVHFVHQATDGSRAVVGVLMRAGADHEVIATLLENDPGHHMATSCTDTVPLDALLPAGDGFFHYRGSLTTPPCSEGLDWFVMSEPIEAGEDQATEWQAEFGGTTNRPLMPLGARTVSLYPP